MGIVPNPLTIPGLEHARAELGDIWLHYVRGGVQLKKGQYLFDLKDVPNEGLWRCRFKAAWRSSTPWLGLSAVFPDLPPLVYVNRIDRTFDIKNSF